MDEDRAKNYSEGPCPPRCFVKKSAEDKPHHAGHRERLHERFFTTSTESLQNYELLELLLFAAIPRRDIKPLAKALLTEFKDLRSLLNAGPHRLIAFGLSE